ncbi:Golgi SNAP receptor complex member 2-like [Symsagittifera roscoffensis]|uniref:Golgi SNAP receptor complex member 2-like n=1 Tax=Symsagittifera roscoffensis TaxID=84072 RepID=UPI00307C16BD
MEALYHDTNLKLEEVKTYLSTYDRCSKAHEAQLAQEIDDKLQVINSNCQKLENKVGHEPPARRMNARMRVNQLKYDYDHVTRALGNIHLRRQEREREERERDELLHRKFTPNDQAIDIGDSLDINSRLQVTNRELDGILSTGGSALDHLRSQRTSMKDIQRKLLDFANTLGLSTTVMKMIEKRGSQDRLILIGGIIITCIIMYLTLSYVRSTKAGTS